MRILMRTSGNTNNDYNIKDKCVKAIYSLIYTLFPPRFSEFQLEFQRRHEH